MAMFLLLLGAVIAALFYIFRSYFFCFLAALVLYFPLRQVNNRLIKLVRKRGLSSFIIVALLCALIIGPVSFVMTSLGKQAYQLYGLLQDKISMEVIENIRGNELFQKGLNFFDINESEINERTGELAREYIFPLFKNITSLIALPLDMILTFLCAMLMLFFLLKDGANFGPFIYRNLPFPDDLERKVVHRLTHVINVLVLGNLSIMLLQGFMLFLGFSIAGISAALLWGAIGSVFSLIPVIGTSIVWAPAAIYLAATGAYPMALFVAVWSLVWYLLLENLLKPVIFGGTLSFHPVVFFFLLLGSIQNFGLPGVLVGPIILTLFVSLWEIYKVLGITKKTMDSNDSGEALKG